MLARNFRLVTLPFIALIVTLPFIALIVTLPFIALIVTLPFIALIDTSSLFNSIVFAFYKILLYEIIDS